jgi:hypothetical protein
MSSATDFVGRAQTVARLNRGSPSLQRCRAGDRLLVPHSAPFSTESTTQRESTYVRSLAATSSASSSSSTSAAVLVRPVLRGCIGKQR